VQCTSHAAGSVAVLTLDNRAELNSLDSALMRAFIGAVEAMARRDDGCLTIE